jgi:hypothetical protein
MAIVYQLQIFWKNMKQELKTVMTHRKWVKGLIAMGCALLVVRATISTIG